MTQAAQTTQESTCSSGLFNSSSFTTPTNTNNSFLNGALGLEILREAQLYNQDGENIFAGVAESCNKGYLGIENCCKSTPGAESDSVFASIAFSAAASTVKYVGEKAVDLASPYVYDAMYDSGIFPDGMLASFGTFASDAEAGEGLAAGGLSVGAFGFTLGTGSMGAGLLGGNIEIASFGSNGYLAFNPYTFAIAVAIQIIMELSQCTAEEQLLALHRGAGLSTFVGETCSQKVLGECLQYTDNYCSFNSILAEIINIQGKEQLGLPIANCQGLSPQQLGEINFTEINFSQFTAQIEQQALSNLPSSNAISTNYQPVMQNTTSGSAQSSSSSVLPVYNSSAKP